MDSRKLCLAQFQYMIKVSTNFTYNSSETVGGVHNTKLRQFCTQMDTWTHGYIDTPTDRQRDRQADSSILPKPFV